MALFEESSDPQALVTPPILVVPRQQLLWRTLHEKDAAVARMYCGAIMARGAENNPDHLSQACHSMRELIDNIPNHFEVPVESAGRLGDRVSAFYGKWKREPRVRNSSNENLSDGFIVEIVAFFDWVEEHQPNRVNEARTIIRALDATGRRLPPSVEEIRASEWMEIRKFFLGGTHHRPCSLEEFDTGIVVFEEFMLSLAKPRTFETATQIDALVAEGESNA
jgi:hypothetical protein